MSGTKFDAEVDRPVDGDTVRVLIDGESESLRVLAIDTEESKPGGGKPVTPWGKKAAEEAAGIFEPGKQLTLEFPGTEPFDVAIEKYRGNFGRPLVFVHVDGTDFQEHMIERGFSPYFTKYGNASFAGHHDRYVAAERRAQAAHRGVWNQVEVNGSVQRDYPALSAWWALRAAMIDDYRRARAAGAAVLNSRLDFAEIRQKAENDEPGVVFTELRDFVRVGARSATINIGSIAQPFQVFIPDIESTQGQELVNLLALRFIAGGSDGRTVTEPRKSYAYLSGSLKIFGGRPEIVISDASQALDTPPA